MKPSNRIFAGLALVAAPIVVFGCSQVAPLKSRTASDGVVALRDDPAAPTNKSGLDENSIAFDDLNIRQLDDDLRCAVAVDQIDNGQASGCATYSVRPSEPQKGELEGELPDGIALEGLGQAGLSPEERFSSLTGDGLSPESFSPNSELQRIGRGGTTRSVEALAVASEVLAQSGVVIDPSAPPEGASPDGLGGQTPGAIVTTP